MHIPSPSASGFQACGGGVGLAAVYHVPLGLALFTAEVLGGYRRDVPVVVTIAGLLTAPHRVPVPSSAVTGPGGRCMK